MCSSPVIDPLQPVGQAAGVAGPPQCPVLLHPQPAVPLQDSPLPSAVCRCSCTCVACRTVPVTCAASFSNCGSSRYHSLWGLACALPHQNPPTCTETSSHKSRPIPYLLIGVLRHSLGPSPNASSPSPSSTFGPLTESLCLCQAPSPPPRPPSPSLNSHLCQSLSPPLPRISTLGSPSFFQPSIPFSPPLP